MTRRRVDDLRREHRTCPTHGLTEFTRYEARDTEIVQFKWVCMACANEASKAYYQFAKSHPETVRARTPKPAAAPGEICESCFTEKSRTGHCYCTE